MERQEVISKLKGLREELEKDGPDALYMPVSVALVLSDVCVVLELSQAEHDEVMGDEVVEAIEEWKSVRLWIPAEMGTATPPVSEVAAVPVA